MRLDDDLLNVFCVIYSDCHNLYNLPNWVESYICSNIQDFNVKFTIIKPLIEFTI